MKTGVYAILVALALTASNCFADSCSSSPSQQNHPDKKIAQSDMSDNVVTASTAGGLAAGSYQVAKEAKEIATSSGLPEYTALRVVAGASAILFASSAGYSIGEGINYVDGKYFHGAMRNKIGDAIWDLARVSEKLKKDLQESIPPAPETTIVTGASAAQ